MSRSIDARTVTIAASIWRPGHELRTIRGAGAFVAKTEEKAMKIEVCRPKRVVRPWRPVIDLRGRHPRVHRGYRARTGQS